jgi:pyruvate formate lyase activating enzyme
MLDKPPTPPATLTRARDLGLKNGLHYVYTGNVHDERGGTTYCPACHASLVGRDWYRLTGWGIEDNTCRRCGQEIPGVFEPRPGSWGARRLPVRIPHHPERA